MLIAKESAIGPPVSVVGVKPEPSTVTWVPLDPWLGVTEVMVGVVSVKSACAESKLPSDPVAVNVLPVPCPVNVNTQLNEPVPGPLPVTVHVPLVVTLAPALIVFEFVTGPPVAVVGVKPVPASVAGTPLGPWFGVWVATGVVTVKDAVAKSSSLLPDPWPMKV